MTLKTNLLLLSYLVFIHSTLFHSFDPRFKKNTNVLEFQKRDNFADQTHFVYLIELQKKKQKKLSFENYYCLIILRTISAAKTIVILLKYMF